MRIRLPLVLSLVSLALGCGAPSHHAEPPIPVAIASSQSKDVSPVSSPAPPIAEGALAYRIERADNDDLVVHLTFRGDASGETILDLPNAWGGEEHLYEGIIGLAVEGADATLTKGERPDRPIVHHVPSGEVHLRYRLAHDADDHADIDSHRYRPVVRHDYFNLIGEAFIVLPSWSSRESRSIDIDWAGFPSGSAIANSFGSGLAKQHITTSLAELRHSIYVGGDFRVRSVEIHGKPVFAAIRGQWSFTDDAFMSLVGDVVRVERGFFDDDDFPTYLVTLIPTGERCCSLGGTGLTNSFATFVSQGVSLDGRMKHLLAHELFHAWNGRKIGRKQPEQLVYWFSEGFTDYYANLLQLRAKLIDLPTYVETYDKVLRDYFLSPARNAKNEEIERSFWKDQDIERLPYQRGNILAHEWNARIVGASHAKASIDDVMRDLFHEAKSNGTVVSVDAIDRLIKKQLPQGIANDVDRYVDGGALLEPTVGALGPCAKLVHKRIGPLDFGFDLAASEAAGKVIGVRPNGPASLAGLRNGQSITHSKYRYDPLTRIEITVGESGNQKERTIAYLPQGQSHDVPQYELDRARFEHEPSDCLAWFGAAP